ENIYYNFDKFNIREDAKVELDKLVNIMKENDITVELGSHTDSRGSFAYNDKLSQKRAESVVKYIVGADIDKNRITAKGYGERQLTNRCADGVYCTPEEHQANRRTEFKVTSYTQKDPNAEYDLSNFSVGDEIPVYMFDKNFFSGCLSDSLPTKIKANAGASVVTPIRETEVQPVNEKQKNKPSDKTNSGTVIYKVNLYALSYEKSLDDPAFKNLVNIQMYRENGMYKYTSGVFNTYQEALEYKRTLNNLGYKDVFVVAFSNGKRIPLGSKDR
ncbi:MAG: OmpA family protein, partial [Lentimicrobiaceae bacterium]